MRLNRLGSHGAVDGIVVTPSHNPPRDGGFKYNPPHGGPADSDATGWIQDRANELLAAGLDGVRRVEQRRRRAPRLEAYDFMGHYFDDLDNVLDLAAIKAAGVRIGADPLGGASVNVLGCDRRAPRARPDRGQPRGRPDLALHDARTPTARSGWTAPRPTRWPR